MYYNNRSNLGSVLPDFTSLFRKLKESLPATPSETKTIGYKKIQTDPVTGALTETTYSPEGAIKDVVRYSPPATPTDPVTGALTETAYSPEGAIKDGVSSDIIGSGLVGSLPLLLAVAFGTYLLLNRK